MSLTAITTVKYETTWNEIVDKGMDTGDEITATLKDGTEITFRAHHDPEGGLYFITRDLPWSHCMNAGWTTKGGYPGSDMRGWINKEILPLFPDELLEVVEPLHIKQAIDGETFECTDPIWIPSLKQIFGFEDAYCTEPEDLPLDGFETEVKRVKGKAEDGETWFWWLRSAVSADFFRCVSSNGYGNYDSAYDSGGFPLGFKVKSLDR